MTIKKSNIYLIIGTVSILSIVIISSSFWTVYAQDENYNIPAWIKNNAKWWVDGKISDSEYLEGIKYLIQHKMIQLDPKQNLLTTNSSSISSLAKSVIPSAPAKNCLDRTFPKVDWSNCDFSGAKLKKADLAESKLMGINFSKANLEKAYLFRTNLKGANLQNAILINTDLADSDLSYANLIGVDGRFVNLNGVNLSHTNLSNANLYNAALMNANMQNANLTGANLNLSDLSYSNLSGADLSGANIADVDLLSANLTNTVLHCIGNPVCVK